MLHNCAPIAVTCLQSLLQAVTMLTELPTMMLAPLTCTLTCKDVTRGNHRYLQVCMRVYVYWSAKVAYVTQECVLMIRFYSGWCGSWSVKVTCSGVDRLGLLL